MDESEVTENATPSEETRREGALPLPPERNNVAGSPERQGHGPCPTDGSPDRRRRNAAIFFPVAALWLVLDLATKAFFNGFPPGTVVTGPMLGLIQFRVAHNTGAAWGMFDQSTIALGVMSLVVCAALTVYLFTAGRHASVPETLGVALIVAGGIGNAVDRFTLGYVVDFIDTVFMSFPTFNIADIGVTCGFVLFFAGLLWSTRSSKEQ
ncbi:signal peptidase II [uncultured Adlercreutzia sp.]|uniref:signal peptidase II n=1 Tax=uncultured Adlercreutzia sp. TaxID=875803 RepID=UPI002600C761|nr:signal peptidase II [uncultured Adlercreutzia sp.]